VTTDVQFLSSCIKIGESSVLFGIVISSLILFSLEPLGKYFLMDR